MLLAAVQSMGSEPVNPPHFHLIAWIVFWVLVVGIIVGTVFRIKWLLRK